jgi:hypothetical protein
VYLLTYPTSFPWLSTRRSWNRELIAALSWVSWYVFWKDQASIYKLFSIRLAFALSLTLGTVPQFGEGNRQTSLNDGSHCFPCPPEPAPFSNRPVDVELCLFLDCNSANANNLSRACRQGCWTTSWRKWSTLKFESYCYLQHSNRCILAWRRSLIASTPFAAVAGLAASLGIDNTFRISSSLDPNRLEEFPLLELASDKLGTLWSLCKLLITAATIRWMFLSSCRSAMLNSEHISRASAVAREILGVRLFIFSFLLPTELSPQAINPYFRFHPDNFRILSNIIFSLPLDFDEKSRLRISYFGLRISYSRLRISYSRLRISYSRLRSQNIRLRIEYFNSYFYLERNAI